MMKSPPIWVWGLAAGGALLLFGASASQSSQSARWTWGRPNSKDQWGNIIYRDPSTVVPAFADKIERIIRRLRARGFDAVVSEAYRTPARAQRLSEGGTGIIKSLHSYNGAVDIVDRKLAWGASAAFKNAVVEEVEREGLFSGRRFSNKDDWAHAQAVTPQQTATFIAASLPVRNQMVA